MSNKVELNYKNEILPENYLQENTSRQIDIYQQTELLLNSKSYNNVLDVGCGAGDSSTFFSKYNMNWYGIDIQESPEGCYRSNKLCNFLAFDGSDIPFNDNSIELVFCRQVFEHVRYPAHLLAEMHRVMAPGGDLVLSASFLEPYHSNSFWGYTPHGFMNLLLDAGFETMLFRPGIDGVTLIIRNMFGASKLFDRWFVNESPINKIISSYGFLRKKDHLWINKKKLSYCGHFCVHAKK